MKKIRTQYIDFSNALNAICEIYNLTTKDLMEKISVGQTSIDKWRRGQNMDRRSTVIKNMDKISKATGLKMTITRTKRVNVFHPEKILNAYLEKVSKLAPAPEKKAAKKEPVPVVSQGLFDYENKNGAAEKKKRYSYELPDGLDYEGTAEFSNDRKHWKKGMLVSTKHSKHGIERYTNEEGVHYHHCREYVDQKTYILRLEEENKRLRRIAGQQHLESNKGGSNV